MRQFFEFERLGTNYRREIFGGVTTFFAMAYIVIVNPAILAAGGMPKAAVTTATVLTAVLGTLMMGLYARRPFAVAPYMGENAFVAYTVCLGMGFSWQAALAAVFISGLIFILTTVLKVRAWITTAIPLCLKRSFAAGIGLFIMFIGLNESGLVRLGVEGAPVKIGALSNLGPLLAAVGIIITCILLIRRVTAAVLLGIVLTSVLAFATGYAPLPQQIIAMPPSLSPVFLALDFSRALQPDFLPVVLVLFILAFVDTMGTLIGVSARAGLLDEEANLPEIEKPMLADAVATTAAGLLGTTTSGAYIESAAGIEAGARSGFAAVVTGGLLALCLFFAPLFVAVPAVAYGAALVVVGFLMSTTIKDLPFDDYAELFPSLATVALMVFTYNIGFGMAAGFVLYPLFKTAVGRGKELKPGVWLLFGLSLLLFVVYPYS